MFTDAFVTYPMECFVEYARKTQPVFQYIYSHQVFSIFSVLPSHTRKVIYLFMFLFLKGEYGLNPDAGLPKFGVNHADELYLM